MGNTALVVADKAIDNRRYNADWIIVPWAESRMRSWLNGYDASSNQPGFDFTQENFIGTGFTSDELSAIRTTTVKNEDSRYYGTPGGNDTEDKVFLLSESETYGSTASLYGFAEDCNVHDEARRCKATDFANAMGAVVQDGNCWWRLRSLGHEDNDPVYVDFDGWVDCAGTHMFDGYNAVRPALILDLTSSHVRMADTVSSMGFHVRSLEIPSDARRYNGHSYRFYATSLTWGAAKEACESVGGHLAVITSADEQQFVESIKNPDDNIWLGGYCGIDRAWRWVTGEAWGYEYWGEGEPNNSWDGEDRLGTLGQHWNDFENDPRHEYVAGYICEWDAEATGGSYEGNMWQFPNSSVDSSGSPAFFGLEGDDYYIMWNEYNRLRDALPKADWLRITMSEDKSGSLLLNRLNPGGELPSGLYKKWGGSCYGMSVWSCLVANGTLKPSYLGNDYTRLRDVPFSGGAESAINFYQVQQFTRIAKQRAWAFCSGAQENQLRYLDAMARKASVEHPFEICFNWNIKKGLWHWDGVGHATVGYGRETGSWTWTVGGKTDTYTSRVRIYDCSYPGGDDYEKACLYYNVAGNLWCIPKWNIRSTSSEAEEKGENNGKLADIESDPDKLNIVDIATGRYSTDGETITAEFLESESANYALTANGKSYAVEGLAVSGPDNDVAVIVDPTDDPETGSGSATAVFTGGSGDVKVSSEDPVGFSLSGQGTYRSVAAGAGGEAVFGRDGSCSVSSNEETGISILVAPDDGGIVGFDGLSVAAADSHELEPTPTVGGLVVEGDNLGQLTCTGVDLNGADGDAEIAVSSNKGSVLVKHDGNGLALFEDGDGDGSYERRVTSTEKDLSKATIDKIPDQAYTGRALMPVPTVRINGSTLESGSDYTVSYRKNTNVGTATVTVTGKGAYSGTKSATFRIVMPFSDVTDKVAHVEDIAWLADSGISKGWDMPDGSVQFRPYANVARADMAAFLFRLARSWGIVADGWKPAGTASFGDVTAKTAHYEEIMWLAESGISQGWAVKGGKEFRPYANVARADMAAFLNRLAQKAGIKEPTGGGVSFKDVTAKTAHAEDIAWLAATGVSKGWSVAGGYEFRPLANVARADMAAFLHRLDALQ